MADRAKTVAVDFDGVIHAYSRGWVDGTIYDEPLPGALDGLRTLMAHHAVFIHTAREPEAVMPWLEGHGFDVTIDERCGRCHGVGGPCSSCWGSSQLRFWNERGQLLVTNRKLPAWRYLDDRAVRFTSWGQALRELLPDRSYDAQHERVTRALVDAWPHLFDDAVYVDQVAAVALAAIEENHA